MHKSKNIVHINTKAKRSQTPYLQEVWPFYSLTSVKDGILYEVCFYVKKFISPIIYNYHRNFSFSLTPPSTLPATLLVPPKVFCQYLFWSLHIHSDILLPGSLTLCLPLDFHNPLHYSPLRLIFLSNFKILLVIVCHCVV